MATIPSAHSVKQLLDTFNDATSVLIVTHNNPDPDAIASAFALAYLFDKALGVTAQIVYKGIVGRAENRAVTRYLNHPLHAFKVADLQEASHVILIDTQPGFGNNPVSAAAQLAAVIDHHERVNSTVNAHFVDIRPGVGAASTILVEYLREAEIPLSAAVATVLFYGIKTDTMGLQRGASTADHHAFCYLLPFVDFEAIARIERAQVSTDYFKTIVETLQSTRIYDAIIISHIPMMRYPDLTADIADLLLRTRGCRWVFCSGIYKETIYFSPV